MPAPIGAVRVFVRDVAKARPFYEDQFGLTVVGSDDSVAIFETGQAKLMVEEIDPSEPEADELVGRLTGICFTVEDIRGAYAELAERGVSFDDRPEIQPWGGALAHFFDPDGNVLTLVQFPEPA